jgi:hypothetical protein
VSRTTVVRAALAGQGAYFLATGMWSVVHRRSFERVSGRKSDYWLVRTVGALAVATGGVLVAAARRPVPSTEARMLATGTSLAFGAVDGFYAGTGRIRRVYLVDLAAQAVFLVLTALPLRNRDRSTAGP